MRHTITVLAAVAALGLVGSWAGTWAGSPPVQAQERQQEWQDKFSEDMKRAEELAKESLEKIRRALSEAVERIPRYSLPEVTPEGDIIIRRLPPKPPTPPTPPKSPTAPDIDETST